MSTEDQKNRQRDHEWRMQHPGTHLVGQLIDGICIVICMAMILAVINGWLQIPATPHD